MFEGADLCEFSLAPDVKLPRFAEVAVRYRGQSHGAWVTQSGPTRAEVAFSEPVAAVVAGQYAVLFDGDRVLGGGRIERATRSSEGVS